MMEQDTVKLLRECDAGIKMGVASIDDVLEHVQAKNFRDRLSVCRSEHKKLEDEVQSLLRQYHDDGKEPNPIAKGMSWMKTNMKLAMDTSDAAIADLMTDGCNMGVKSLHKYLNQYQAANEKSKEITRKLRLRRLVSFSPAGRRITGIPECHSPVAPPGYSAFG